MNLPNDVDDTEKALLGLRGNNFPPPQSPPPSPIHLTFQEYKNANVHMKEGG